MCVCVYLVWRLENDTGISSRITFSPYFWSECLFLNLQLSIFAGPPGKRVPGSTCLWVSVLVIQAHTAMKGIEGKELEMYWLQTHYTHVLMSKTTIKGANRKCGGIKDKNIAHSNPRSDDTLFAIVQSVKTSFYNIVCKFSWAEPRAVFMERKAGESTAASALQDDLPYQGQTEGLPCMLSSGWREPSVLLENRATTNFSWAKLYHFYLILFAGFSCRSWVKRWHLSNR